MSMFSGGGACLVGQKGELLGELSDRNLLELARSVSKHFVDGGTSRSDLVKIVKASLSVEEIKQGIQKVNSSMSHQAASGNSVSNLKLAAIAQIFLVVWSFANLLVNIADEYISTTVVYTPSITASQNVQLENLLSIVASLFLILFALLEVSAMIKMRPALSGNRLGISGGLVALFASLAGTVSFVSVFLGLNQVTIELPSGGTYQGPSLLGIVAPILYEVLLIAAVLLIGLFFLLNRKRFFGDDLWFATGMIYLFAASAIFTIYYIAIFSSVVEYSPLLLIGGIMGSACFTSQRSSKT
jgi:hypothetical protein